MPNTIPPWMIPDKQRRDRSDQPVQIPLHVPQPPPGYYDRQPPHRRPDEDDDDRSVTIDIGGDRGGDEDDKTFTYRF